MPSEDYHWIPTPSLNAADAAMWWASLDCEGQAEFLRKMMSALDRACEGGSKSRQLHSIGKELGRDINMGVALDLRDMLEASGYAGE